MSTHAVTPLTTERDRLTAFANQRCNNGRFDINQLFAGILYLPQADTHVLVNRSSHSSFAINFRVVRFAFFPVSLRI
jgi:hypothetical protein